MDAARTIGVGRTRLFTHHLLPSILGTIIVYATLTVPTAILSEAFLSFLGIGIREPLPSWGNLAADGLSQLNTVHSRWWLLFWPCSWGIQLGHQQQNKEIQRIRDELVSRVGVLEKWRHVLIGGSIVIGFMLHKFVNFGS